MTDIQFVCDGNASTLKNNGNDLINVERYSKINHIVTELKRLQKVEYSLSIVEFYQGLIVRGLSASKGSEELFERSLEVEPREREDEKILRLLNDKGFG